VNVLVISPLLDINGAHKTQPCMHGCSKARLQCCKPYWAVGLDKLPPA
jgi:hypothetical protein